MIKFGFVFLLLLAASALWGARGGAGADSADASGPARNGRLTALTGLLLYVLLAAIAITVLDIKKLLAEHYLAGFILIPPIVLKLGSTGYRFLRYYSGSTAYRSAGAPSPLLRFAVAPALVVSTVVVFASGIELWLFGLRFGSVWILAHTLSAVVMMLAVTAHVAAHMGRSTNVLSEELRAPGRDVFSLQATVAAGLVAGAVLAVASLLYASPFTAGMGGG